MSTEKKPEILNGKRKVIFMKIIGSIAVFHAVTSMGFTAYFGVLDLFTFLIFSLEFAIGILCFVGVSILRDAEYHKEFKE